MEDKKILDISWATFFRFFLAVLAFYLVYRTRDILILFIFALIISILFNPAIDFLTKRKVPRFLAIVSVYLSVFGFFGLLLYSIAPIFIYEIQQFTQLFPQYFEKFAPVLEGLGLTVFENFESFTGAIQGWLVEASSGIFNAIGAIFGSIFSTVTIFSIAIFLSLEEKGIERTLSLLFPKKYETQVLSIWNKCQNSVASWFSTRILSCLFVGVMTFAACKILAIKYAISFGLLAGITNIVPIIGPIIAAAVIILFTLLESWSKALFILIIFVLIQQIEGNIITPLLSKKFIGLPPVLVLLALLVGGELWGIMGAFLAIPFFGILFEFAKEFLKKRREEKTDIL
jgi:predicted PurR-regulated permease PerM